MSGKAYWDRPPRPVPTPPYPVPRPPVDPNRDDGDPFVNPYGPLIV